MIIQSTPYGTKKEEPFAFTYSGDFTDERVDGVGDVTLNTSGTLTVTSGKATVQAYILGGGGGGAYYKYNDSHFYHASGGGGGQQTVEIELTQGTYEIVIGAGGAGKAATSGTSPTASNGGDTTAFGYTSTGGEGRRASLPAGGASGGTPNGSAGSFVDASSSKNIAGGSPNGGAATSTASNNKGGNGLVRLTFS